MKDALNARILLLLALVFLGMTLYGKWQEEHPVEHVVEKESATDSSFSNEIPATFIPVDESPQQAPVEELVKKDALIFVETDLLKLNIDRQGGDIVYAELKKYPESKDNTEKGFVLLDRSDKRYYIAQTGLSSSSGPDSPKEGRAIFQADKSHYYLSDSADSLNVTMTWTSPEGISFKKIYTFKRDKYLVEVSYEINNVTDNVWRGSFYGQIQRKQTKSPKGFLMGMQTYQGGALYTPEKKFKKVSFSDMEAKTFKESIHGGWAAMVEHYFLSAWIPNQEIKNNYYTSVVSGNKFNIGSLTSVLVQPHSKSTVKGQLFLGPEIGSLLEDVAPGLELTVDYGILWPISQVIFWTMKKINHFVGNWGVSIILITCLIKALFYKLSAASYRSMGHLRRVQPKIQAMKERFGDDKQKFSQAMMELYKKERINPLGGCLPILIQIPVFIALYYVLLESVELRQAPFMLWIQDLSAKDPYFVLPVLMGISMLLQQRLSPQPPDPMQAKMMMLMPIVFTFLFLAFPAGLVLYWLVNNMLSILQQWFIMRKLEKEGLGRKSHKAIKSNA